MRDYRARRRANGGARLTAPIEPAKPREVEPDPPRPMDPANAVAEWAETRLKVPPGHADAGKPMTLPPFAIEFFREALAPGIREAGLFVARKNAKSAALAVLILAHLADDGPLRRRGWRCGAASTSRDKAKELWKHCVAIAQASSLSGIWSGKVPLHVSSDSGECEFLSADKTAGHASGFDLAVADELGLFPERGGRDLVAGLLSSTSARDGRLIAISVIGDSPLSTEMIKRAGDPATVVHVYQAPEKCALDDPAAWELANPALGTIKSRSYMADMARRALANPQEASSFRVFDLNRPGVPERVPIVPAERYALCAAEPQPARHGRCFVGFDIGGASSLTAAALYWPECGRLEVWGAIGDEPPLSERGRADGVGDRYQRMNDRGELRTFPGMVTPVAPFLAWIDEILGGAIPAHAVADFYKGREAQTALNEAGTPWPVEWRRAGAGPHGFEDVRAFQRAVLSRTLRPGHNLMLDSAILESTVEPDRNGNPCLDKRRQRGRIDALSAAVFAIGAGERAMAPAGGPATRFRSRTIGGIGMTRVQKLQLRAAKVDGRIAEIIALPEGERTDAIKDELVALNAEKTQLPDKLEKAIAAEEEGARLVGDQANRDGAFAEMAHIAAQASVGEFLANLYNKTPHDGALAELQSHYGMSRNELPLDLLRGADGVMAAATAAPDNVRRSEQPVVQPVFATGDAAFLMIDMPTVEAGDAAFPVLTTRPTVGGPHTDSTAVAETDGTFAAESLSPQRIQAGFSYRRTDASRFPQMDPALRSALTMGLAEALDAQVVGQIVTDVSRTEATAENTFQTYATALVYSHVDGRWAMTSSDMRVMVGGATLAHMSAQYRNGAGNDTSAWDRVERIAGGTRISAHIAAVAANKQDAIVRRGMRRDMVCPLWRNVEIVFDEVTRAAEGEIKLTAALHFAKKVIRAEGFARVQTQHA